MSPVEPRPETLVGSRAQAPVSTLGTLGWVGAVLVGAVVALLLLSWLGPVGGH